LHSLFDKAQDWTAVSPKVIMAPLARSSVFIWHLGSPGARNSFDAGVHAAETVSTKKTQMKISFLLHWLLK
jgi:hypothetical protein